MHTGGLTGPKAPPFHFRYSQERKGKWESSCCMVAAVAAGVANAPWWLVKGGALLSVPGCLTDEILSKWYSWASQANTHLYKGCINVYMRALQTHLNTQCQPGRWIPQDTAHPRHFYYYRKSHDEPSYLYPSVHCYFSPWSHYYFFFSKNTELIYKSDEKAFFLISK